jgi:galactokinase
MIRVLAPGRLCLIGEHQDYLNLEVVSGALDLHVEILGKPIHGEGFHLHLVKTGEDVYVPAIDPGNPPDNYFESGLICMLQQGFAFPQGYHVTVKGTLPMGKGVSSSSALCTAWITFLSVIASEPRKLTPERIAHLAFSTEVTAFDQPGGMQDHIASATGGLQHMDFRNGRDRPVIAELPVPPTGFLLVDSGSVKDTVGMIQSIRTDIETSCQQLGRVDHQTIQLNDLSIADIPREHLRNPIHHRLLATLINRNLTRAFITKYKDAQHGSRERLIGRFMNTHHHVLRTLLNTSSPAIDQLCQLALKSGAWGAKVVGSGGGGCLLVYAPENMQPVCDALSGADVAGLYPVHIGPGVTAETVSSELSSQ